MRPHHAILRPAHVQARAMHLLASHLEMRDYKAALPVRTFCAILLLAASWQVSLSTACRLVKVAPSHETVRKALYACLPSRPRELAARLRKALRDSLPDHLLGAVPQPMALDLHQRPYYGKKNTRGSTRRERKKGTRGSFTYATLAVLAPSGRFTVGLLLTRPLMRLLTIVRALLAQADEAGLSASYLLMDKEFCTAEVVAWLQKKGIRFITPLQCRRHKDGTGNDRLFREATPPGWYDYRWTGRLRRYNFKGKKWQYRGEVTVEVRACVGKVGKKGKRLVYACHGMNTWSPAAVAREYRKRFGIEASYRQLGQCLAPTSSRDERWRLLLVGVALLLCNLWSYLHDQVFSAGPLGGRRLQHSLLRLCALTRALAMALATFLGGLVEEWAAQRTIPKELIDSLQWLADG
jgi:hypothetical protein